MSEKPTIGPWTWTIEDKSMATLHGPDYFYNHVMSVSPCKSCIESMDDGESPLGKCTMPSVEDAKIIAAARELLDAGEMLLEQAALMRDPRWSADMFDSNRGVVAMRAAITKAKG